MILSLIKRCLIPVSKIEPTNLKTNPNQLPIKIEIQHQPNQRINKN